MIEVIRRHVIPAAYAVLPPTMASVEATAMLLAIGLQESKFEHRRQVGGPARSFWQFEEGGGVRGVLTHVATRGPFAAAAKALAYRDAFTPFGLHQAMEHNDILAAVCARLLLWSHPSDLCRRDAGDRAWDLYLSTWRPGKPHPETWAKAWATAWEHAVS